MKLTKHKLISIACGIAMIVVFVNKLAGMIILGAIGAGLWLTDKE